MSQVIISSRRDWKQRPRCVVAPANSADAALSTPVILSSGRPFMPTMYGGARISDDGLVFPAAGSYAEYAADAAPISQDFTITLAFRTGASLTNQTLIASSNASIGYRTIRILIVSATSLQFLIAEGSGIWADDTKTLNGITLQTNSEYVMVARFKYIGRYAGVKDVTINGYRTLYTDYPQTPPSKPVGLRFGRESTSTESDFVGVIRGYFCERRFVSDSEAYARCINPWKIFAKRDRIAFINTTGGSASYTITPTGSISLSGISTQIKNKIFQASVTVNLTGSASLSLTNGAIEYTISPTGSITYSGTYKARVVRALSPSGTITYSGNAIRATTHIQTSSGLITFSGNAPLYIPGSYIPTTSILLTGVGK